MPKIAQIFSARVPRYTSYPTAPHFHAGIDQAVYRRWLSELPRDEAVSLYMHVPFCDTLCWFCGCHTTVVNSPAPVEAYCGLLLKEIALVARALGTRRKVSHIHWGGGSPTILGVDGVARLDAVTRACFDVLPGAEFAIEIDPRGLSEPVVAALAAAGVTRASIGLQDCNPKVQKAINRIQTDTETAEAVRLIRAAGIGSLNIDLIYGLPHQTLADWRATLDFALSLSPDRMAVFGYAHVPDFKKHQALIPEDALPDIRARFAQAELARRVLCDRGYAAVGLDHFAKPGDALARAAAAGRLARNFQGYTDDGARSLIGFGASAISSLPQGYVQNAPAVPAWRKALAAWRLPVARGIALTADDRIRRHVIERLMCDFTVDLERAASEFGASPAMFREALAALSGLAADGLVTVAGHVVTVPEEWRAAARLAAASFDAHLPAGAARHSLPV